MINKVNGVNATFKARTKANVATASKQKSVSNNSQSLAGSQYASALQAMNGIKVASTVSFGALTKLEESIIGSKEIRIPNLLDLEEDINLPLKEMPKGTEHLNAVGLNVKKVSEGKIDTYTITNDYGNALFVGKVDTTKAQLPVLTYKQGKFMPEITVKDPSLKGKSVKMLAGSQLIGDGFELKMIGDYQPDPMKNEKKTVSFSGRTVISTLNKEPRTLNAVDSYMQSGLQAEAVRGDYADMVQADDPTIIIPAGGFGERFFNITREDENKPSGKLPTHDNYRIIATALNLAASAGVLGGSNDSVVYLSQNHEIPEGGDVKYVAKYKTDGGAIAEGLKRDIIDVNKPAMILNADIFTNADISRAYKALKTLPNAALVIPYYPVNADRAKSFGLLGIEQDEAGNLQIKEFLEKPKYTKAPEPNNFAPREYDLAMQEFLKVQTALDPNDGKSFLINPGFYFLSPESLKVLMAKGILEKDKTGLGAHVMPKIVELANNGELVDAKGNQMKVYTVPLETKGGTPAVWDDIGTAEAYLKLIKDVASEIQTNGNTPANKYYGVPEFVMEDFAANTDLETGIVYDSAEARQAFTNFCEKYDVQVAEGNIFVAGNK